MTQEIYQSLTPYERQICDKIHKEDLITNDTDLSWVHEQDYPSDRLPDPLRDLSDEEIRYILDNVQNFWLKAFPETRLTKKGKKNDTGNV